MSIELFPGKHLFVDDYRIEGMTAAKRVLNRARKHPGNPVLGRETIVGLRTVSGLLHLVPLGLQVLVELLQVPGVAVHKEDSLASRRRGFLFRLG